MRPRFSVRVLLVVFALLATVCYVFLVRPTVIAKRFVAAVNARDYRLAETLLKQQRFESARNLIAHYTSPASKSTTKTDRIYAELLPRQWSDIWSFQRRLIFRVTFHDDTDGRHLEWVEDTRLVAEFDGVTAVRDWQN